MNTVVFDLDGTISDPAKGITRSINYALAELGFKTHPEEELLGCIGPHLQIIFSELTGIEDEMTLSRAVELYRERYTTVGYKENRLYENMVDVLSYLVSNGSLLCIATAKRKDIASQVLEYFEIDQYFTQVHGCDLHRSKTDLLRDILSDPNLGSRPIVMIGDKDSDFLAASEVAMPSIAVRWGYGKDEEFSLATDIAEKPTDLPDAIMRNAQQVNTPDADKLRR